MAPRASTSRTTTRSFRRTCSRRCSGPRPIACAASTITPGNLKNQQDVVKNEVRVNVLNQPYGGFPWIDLPHGREQELVQRPQLLRRPRAPRRGDARRMCSAFFKTYYAPNNAVLVVAGDFDPATRRRAWIAEVLRRHPLGELPAPPDLTRAAPGEGEARRAGPTRSPAARRSGSPTTCPSAQHARVVRVRPARSDPRAGRRTRCSTTSWSQARPDRSTSSAGINLLGNMFDYSGPMLWIA